MDQKSTLKKAPAPDYKAICGIIYLIAIISCTSPEWQPPKCPSVASLDVPLYDALSMMKNIEGAVRIKVVTNGYTVTETQIESGQVNLARAAISNLMTWKFRKHNPTSFTVTYKYKLTGKSTRPPEIPAVIILRLPTEVEVIHKRTTIEVDRRVD
jgi:hypothetical protein